MEIQDGFKLSSKERLISEMEAHAALLVMSPIAQEIIIQMMVDYLNDALHQIAIKILEEELDERNTYDSLRTWLGNTILD